MGKEQTRRLGRPYEHIDRQCLKSLKSLGGLTPDMLSELCGDHSFTKEQMDEYGEAKEVIFRDLVRKDTAKYCPEIPGSVAFIKWAKSKGVRMSCVTNAPRLSAECMLTELGVLYLFEHLVIGAECPRG